MKKEKCASCGGLVIPKKVEYEKKMGSHRLLFEQVPAKVCTSCDEVWIEGKIAEKMEKLFQKGIKPTRRITVPVWSFSNHSKVA